MNQWVSTLFLLVIIISSPVLFYFKERLFSNQKHLMITLIIVKLVSIIYTIIYVYVYYGKKAINLKSYNVLFISALFIILGQLLNLSVYYKLGFNGVYYGNEYNIIDNNEIQTFPYNLFKNPQYIGCILTTIGLTFLLMFNRNMSIRYPIVSIGLVEMFTYVFAIILNI